MGRVWVSKKKESPQVPPPVFTMHWQEGVLQVSLCPSPRKKGTIMGTKGLQQCILILRVVVLGRWGQGESQSQGQPRLQSKTLSQKQTKDRRTGIVFCVI